MLRHSHPQGFGIISGCEDDSTNDVMSLSGASLSLQPCDIQPKLHSVKWTVQFFSNTTYLRILTWTNGSSVTSVTYGPWVSNHFNKRLNFTIKNFTLHIMAVQKQDSGFYFLEVTNVSGGVSNTRFQVLVFDGVKDLSPQEEWKVLDGGLCQVNLTCSVSSDGDVSYTWYNGSELLPRPRNLNHLVLLINGDGLHTFTCNVSNPLSSANHTFSFTQKCWSAHKNLGFLPFLVSIMVLLIITFLGTLTCFCVWRKKRKQPDTGTENFLTVYRDVNNRQIRRDEEQELNSPGEGSTIYSTIQHSDSTTQDTVKTIYSSVQPSRKSGSKKRNHSPSNNCTIYEEVGRSQPRAQNPARLSRRELENFHVYS
ncbi:natural killer cell receptor 2B4 isoform X2 [Dasypus novemcinctus]|uniref:natural killer cell receptor 2B4 isoform X2 n=1 Tax=Dasypus novemcinctus TaxID=9361 RepID=UPI000329133D|nr:natural killer cell receptor 2B4 isoform X2 [Dasypus novemcinctus]